jgi:thioredoxin-like negative regulator of GroEL
MIMSKGDDLDRMINSTDALLVYFFSDHCPPCISLRPKVGQLMAEEFPKMELVLVNSELYPELAASHQVFSLPVIMIFFEGKEFLRFSKYVSLSELKESIGRIYQLYYS